MNRPGSTASDASIRVYGEADGAECARIFREAWHAGHPYAPRELGMPEFRAETSGEIVLVAVTGNGAVAGFAGVYLPGSFVHHLYVDPLLHRRGIGRALLAAALSVAGGRATLKGQQRNPDALTFYRRLGWTSGETGDSAIGPWVMMHSPEGARLG
jgi:GNAT superfamily N-acetyltransferase